MSKNPQRSYSPKNINFMLQLLVIFTVQLFPRIPHFCAFRHQFSKKQ